MGQMGRVGACVWAGCASEVAASVRTEGDAVKKKLPFWGGRRGVQTESEFLALSGGLTEAVFPLSQYGKCGNRVVV